MVFSRFLWSVLAFVALIVGSSILLGIYIQKPEFPVTVSLLAFALVAETVLLIRYLTKIRRDLLRLILAMSNDDPTLQFSRMRRDPYFNAIHSGFNELIRDFKLVRLDREAQQRFFEETVNHVQFGLIAYNEAGEVRMVNRAFTSLFGLQGMSRLDQLNESSAGLSDYLMQFSPGRESLQKLELPDGQHHLIFLSSGFVLKGEKITLVSVRDLSREMDRNELDAWQKLLRVLRHEILNSISPIQLIAGNLYERLQPHGELLPLEKLRAEEVEEIRSGLDTIQRRASGLSVFLDAYSNLYRTPEFHPEPTEIGGLLQRTAQLFRKEADKQGTLLKVHCDPENLSVPMDARMIEQVLINLVKNAMEAVKGTEYGTISLLARMQAGDVILTVEDTGTGIPQEELESIFIPFFSTREAGTGIGLSFSQHVMRLHQGVIRVRSAPGKGSAFHLHFKQK